MTTITIHKNNAVWIVFVYTYIVMLYDYLFPNLMIMPFCVWITFFLLYELALCCWPQKTKSSHESAGEPATEVATITSLEPKVGEDADETRDNDEKKRHHHDSDANRPRFVLRRH